MTVGVLHPGAMGTTVAAACAGEVLWCSAGRSDATLERADAAGLVAVPALDEFVERSDVIVSVCPPGSATTVAADVAELWAGSLLDARPIDGGPGAASALKMAYALWTKVSSSMLLTVRALATAAGVDDALLAEWDISQPGTAERSEMTASMTAPKAWRFVGEMEQIASTLAANGLPSGFGEAAADLSARLAEFRDQRDVTLAEVLDRLGRT